MSRVDVWLWSVRVFKTRSAATAAVKGGHVRVNDDPTKPGAKLKIGDVVTVRYPGYSRIFKVEELLSKRVGAPAAAKAYQDLSPPKPAHLFTPVARRDRGAGRPTKRDRRQLEKLGAIIPEKD